MIDADALVAELYGPGGGAVAAVEAAFPGSSAAPGGPIDRAALSRHVVGDAEALRRLEALVHPLVEAERRRRVAALAAEGHALVAADVPLLYESGSEGAFDAVAVVRCPPAAQRERVLARPGMSTEKFEGLLARQLPAEEKAARADFVIDTGRAPRATRGEVEALVRRLRGGALGARARARARARAPPGAEAPPGGELEAAEAKKNVES